MKTDDSGVVLLLVLVMLVVLTAIVVQFMFSTHVDSRIADVQMGLLKNDAAIDGGVAKAIALLARDMAEEEKRVDSCMDLWATGLGMLTFEGTEVCVIVVDEQGKLNLNLLAESKQASCVRTELNRLMKLMELDDLEAKNAAGSIADWIDADSTGSFEEDSPNRKLMDTCELLGIEHVDEDLYYGATIPEAEVDPEIELGTRPTLHRFVTIWGPGAVNINTAPAEVLAALSKDMDLERARAIADFRNEGGVFSTLRDLLEVEGVTQKMLSQISGRICVSSGYFSVLCFAETEGVKSIGVAVIKRDSKECRIIRFSVADSRLWQAYVDEIKEIGARSQSRPSERGD